MARQQTQRMRAVATGLLMGWMILALSASTLAQETPPIDREGLLRQLGVDAISADYVVLIDTSKSMLKENRYSRVLDALDGFVGALSPGDRLTLITFDAIPTVFYAGPVGEDPTSIVGRLPREPGGNYTDIGAALRAAVDELGRPGAADVRTLIVLTDGVHDPTGGTLFPGKTGEAWSRLRESADGITGRHLRVYPMALTGGTDIGLVVSVFPEAKALQLPTGQLESYFDQVKEETGLEKAALLLADDRSKSVSVAWPTEAFAWDITRGSAEIALTLTSPFTRTPVQVTNLSLEASGTLPVRFGPLPESVSLEPGESTQVQVLVEWAVPQSFHFGEHVLERQVSISLSGATTSPWAAVMEKELGITLASSVTSNTASAVATGQVGTSWLLIAAIGLGGLVLLRVLWLIVRPPRRPQLAGSYRLGRADENVRLRGEDRSLSADARGGSVLRFGGVEGEGPRVPLAGLSGDVLVLEARRETRRGSVRIFATAAVGTPSVRYQREDGRWATFHDDWVQPGTVLELGEHVIWIK